MRWMSRRRYISRFVAVAACASSLCVVGRALGFKSLHTNATPTPPTPAANFPFPGHRFGLTGVAALPVSSTRHTADSPATTIEHLSKFDRRRRNRSDTLAGIVHR
jgi:hypothetical protein